MHSKWKNSFIFISLFLLCGIANISAVNTNINSSIPFTSNELDTIKQYLLNNIATEDHVTVKEDEGRIIRSAPGAVLASPTNKGEKFIQDYQFHWVRDAAITMSEVVYLYSHGASSDKQQLKPYLLNYINFERKAQKQISRPGEQTLGQPKYNIDGTIWEGEWGRPQNDGPGLRAMTMTTIANLFIQEGNEKFVREVMVDVITTDLDYVCSQWKATNFDLWEEVDDQDHFFNKMVQRKGLINGADLLKYLGDNHRADNYLYVANQITESLNKHWHSGRGYFTETVNQQYYKGGGINTSIILGVLHGDLGNPDDAFAVNNDRVMSTIYYIRNAFSGLYRVNIDNHLNPPMVGRYPNDVYDGDQNNYGNPWILTTNALAQYYYSLANAYLKLSKITVTQNNILFFQQIDSKLVSKEGIITLTENPGMFYGIIDRLVEEGDKALANVKKYAVCNNDYSCLHFAEQIDRTNSQQVSAKDLTWSYASLLSAVQTRFSLHK